MITIFNIQNDTVEVIEEVAPSFEEPLTESEIRDKRNRLLAKSDWTQLADAPVDRNAWAVYRQALRDIPEQPEFPKSVKWPEPPRG